MAALMRRLGPGSTLRAVLITAVVSLAVPATASSRQARPLVTGFDEPLFQSSNESERRLWLDRAKQARAGMVRLVADWADIAPATQPPGFSPADPADPAYRWDALDAEIRDASSRRLRVLLLIFEAPRWAEGPGRPQDAPRGTWQPDPGAVRQFATALARRYSGGFADPDRPGDLLPRVTLFQVWTEPNLSAYLGPQWSGRKAVGPRHYREMLNAGYAGVKAAQRSAKVVTAGFAPYGDPRGGDRIRPVLFVRELLCLKGSQLRPSRCPNPARFDVLAHHPINVGAPTRSALHPLDASTPDFAPLRQALHKAIRTGRALPGRSKPIWATEIWWDSDPPDPFGVPQHTQARWYEQAFYVLWKQGVRTVLLLQVRDSPAESNYLATLQSGIFFLNGKPKPSYRAVRFPFVTERLNRRTVRAWGVSPVAGRVRIQRRGRKGWDTVRTVVATPRRPFLATVPARGRVRFRAKVGSETSLGWIQR